MVRRSNRNRNTNGGEAWVLRQYISGLSHKFKRRASPSPVAWTLLSQCIVSALIRAAASSYFMQKPLSHNRLASFLSSLGGWRWGAIPAAIPFPHWGYLHWTRWDTCIWRKSNWLGQSMNEALTMLLPCLIPAQPQPCDLGKMNHKGASPHFVMSVHQQTGKAWNAPSALLISTNLKKSDSIPSKG